MSTLSVYRFSPDDNLKTRWVLYRLDHGLYAQAAEMRERGLLTTFCTCCGVGPFIRVPERANPRLCIDCAAGRGSGEGIFRCREKHC